MGDSYKDDANDDIEKTKQKPTKSNKKNGKTEINKKFESLGDTIYYSQIPRVLTNDPSHINKVNIDKT